MARQHRSSSTSLNYKSWVIEAALLHNTVIAGLAMTDK